MPARSSASHALPCVDDDSQQTPSFQSVVGLLETLAGVKETAKEADSAEPAAAARLMPDGGTAARLAASGFAAREPGRETCQTTV